jgi:hemolysin III
MSSEPHGTVRDEVVPLLRGVSHAYAFWFAVAAAAGLVVLAPGSAARWPAALYGAGLCALFAASAVYHRWRWNPRWRPLLQRIDHSTIFVFIAASYTPVAVLVLSGPLRSITLIGVWVGAAAGIALNVAWITAPRALIAASYLAVGWFAIVALPQLVHRLPVAPLVLLGGGGILYSVGAAVYALKRPNPWPRTFGFHEVFHALVIGAAVTHFVAIAGWVIPRATG